MIWTFVAGAALGGTVGFLVAALCVAGCDKWRMYTAKRWKRIQKRLSGVIG